MDFKNARETFDSILSGVWKSVISIPIESTFFAFSLSFLPFWPEFAYINITFFGTSSCDNQNVRMFSVYLLRKSVVHS